MTDCSLMKGRHRETILPEWENTSDYPISCKTKSEQFWGKRLTSYLDLADISRN